jgi:hypothetical protein
VIYLSKELYIGMMEILRTTLHGEEAAHDTHHEKSFSAKKHRQHRIRRIISFLLVAVIFFICTTLFSQYQVYILQKIAKAQEEVKPEVPVTSEQIVKAVSRHIRTPAGVPQIAEVKEAQKLIESQPFFKDVINGDIIIVYDTMVLIYRPLEDVLVSVGDFSVSSK